MKEPKRVKKYIRTLHEVADIIDYEYGHRRESRQIIRELSELEDYLCELSISQKELIHRIRGKFRTIWDIEENERIAQKIEELKDMV
jgi:hypothetical protein